MHTHRDSCKGILGGAILLAVAACQPFPSYPLSWRMGITRGPDGAALVHLRWEPGAWQPTIATIPLKTIARPEGVWVTSDERLYATWEVGPGYLYHDHHIRVYRNDGTVVGEYKAEGETEELTAPTIIEEDKTVCFMTGTGGVVLGHPVGDPPRYVFRALPNPVPNTYKHWCAEFSKTYELNQRRIVCDGGEDSKTVYGVHLDTGSITALSRGILFGVLQAKPVVMDRDAGLVVVLDGEPQPIGPFTFHGLKAPYRVERLSPCGRYYVYDVELIQGGRLRLVERQTGRERILDRLGCVTSVGSWWAD